jgi:hypothetical protein
MNNCSIIIQNYTFPEENKSFTDNYKYLVEGGGYSDLPGLTHNQLSIILISVVSSMAFL